MVLLVTMHKLDHQGKEAHILFGPLHSCLDKENVGKTSAKSQHIDIPSARTSKGEGTVYFSGSYEISYGKHSHIFVIT